jgi:hypothetical protein
MHMHAMRVAALLVTLPAIAAAQTAAPAVENGTITRRIVSQALDREFSAITRANAGPLWIGYAVRGRDRSGGDGCGDYRRGGVRVSPLRLEGSADLFILYRVEHRVVGRIEIAAPDCPLDLGGLSLHWLAGVTAAASLEWLDSFARADLSTRAADGAVLAMALHGDPAAVDRLISIAKDGRHRRARSTALFWVSQRAGERAAAAMIDVAKNNRHPEVRKQAMFWLGQSQDARALAFFEEVLRK